MSEELATYQEHATSARSFGEIPALWLKVFEMTETFFAEQAPFASGTNTLITVLIVGAISAVMSSLSALASNAVQMLVASGAARDILGATLGSRLLFTCCGGLFASFLAFYLGNALVYLGARIFGGSGDFTTQSYLQSLFVAPISIATSVLSLVGALPWVGPCALGIILLGVSIYAVILNVRAVKVAHELDTGRAVAAVFVPVIALSIVVVCLAAVVILALALLGPAIGEIFENIVTTI